MITIVKTVVVELGVCLVSEKKILFSFPIFRKNNNVYRKLFHKQTVPVYLLCSLSSDSCIYRSVIYFLNHGRYCIGYNLSGKFYYFFFQFFF